MSERLTAGELVEIEAKASKVEFTYAVDYAKDTLRLAVEVRALSEERDAAREAASALGRLATWFRYTLVPDPGSDERYFRRAECRLCGDVGAGELPETIQHEGGCPVLIALAAAQEPEARDG